MKFPCPVCGAEIGLEQAEAAGDLLALHRAAGAFGDDWALVREYLELFRSAGRDARTTRPLKVAKLLRLAREVWAMWGPGKFEFQKSWWVVGKEEFREALRAACNQVTGPLTSHNYLKKVLMAGAKKTSRRREAELREREAGLGSGRPESPPSLPEMPPRVEGVRAETPAPPDPEWRARFKELSRAVRRPGLTAGEREKARKALEEFLGSAGGAPAPTGES